MASFRTRNLCCAHLAERVTPYSLGATEAFDMVFNGGKQDDITVVVATLCARPHVLIAELLHPVLLFSACGQCDGASN